MIVGDKRLVVDRTLSLARPDGTQLVTMSAHLETVRQFYRFQEARYSGGVLMLLKLTYPVIKDTPTGVWLDVFGQRRFCRTDARKRFACPTEQDALESYHARKRRQVRILKRQLAEAETALTLQTDGEMAPVLERSR